MITQWRRNGTHGSRLGLGAGDVQRPAQLQRSPVPGSGQNRSTHPQAALLPRRRMGMDCRGRVVCCARPQPRAAYVLRRNASDCRSQFPSRLFRIGRLASHTYNIIIYYLGDYIYENARLIQLGTCNKICFEYNAILLHIITHCCIL